MRPFTVGNPGHRRQRSNSGVRTFKWTAGDDMKSVAYHSILIAAALLCAISIPVQADITNGFHLYSGQPSARFPAGSHPCAGCHELNVSADPVLNGANDPGAVSYTHLTLPTIY